MVLDPGRGCDRDVPVYSSEHPAGTYSETCCRNFIFDFLAIGKERLAPKGGVFQIEGQAGGSRYTLLGIGELASRHGGT